MANNTEIYESAKITVSLWKEVSDAGDYKNRDGEVISDDFFWEAAVNEKLGWVVAEKTGALKVLENDSDLFKYNYEYIPPELRQFFNAPYSPGNRKIILRYKNRSFTATISLLSLEVKSPLLKFSPDLVPIISEMKTEIESTTQSDSRENIPVLTFEPTETADEYELHFCRISYRLEELKQKFPVEEKERRERVRKNIEEFNKYIISGIKKINYYQQLYTPKNPTPAISFGEENTLNQGRTNLSYTTDNEDNINIYYLFPYVPKTKGQRNWRSREIYLDITSDILRYKNLIKPAFCEYTACLYLGILELSRIIPQKSIGLVGIPSSDCNSQSPSLDSIKLVLTLSKIKEVSLPKDYDKILIDFRAALIRKSSIPKSHLGNHVSREDKKASLAFCEKEITDDETAYIILDDITTRGGSMLAAKDILEEHGANPDNIYMLALGKTVGQYESL